MKFHKYDYSRLESGQSTNENITRPHTATQITPYKKQMRNSSPSKATVPNRKGGAGSPNKIQQQDHITMNHAHSFNKNKPTLGA